MSNDELPKDALERMSAKKATPLSAINIFDSPEWGRNGGINAADRWAAEYRRSKVRI